eukprot:CAMPEP_0195107614 /NCGR_PEP_ID=MMETSP0448-20130528/82185_1 /TAXON_ID=66468 /ORGANISM="Heterocapsa triquestra, Strain CCMP 448" /LENGTH=51 /DNA_ID=CAMNT_0040144071 /DNA_START=19 /DNA_END=175 /DNA_ORIENTATION=+
MQPGGRAARRSRLLIFLAKDKDDQATNTNAYQALEKPDADAHYLASAPCCA